MSSWFKCGAIVSAWAGFGFALFVVITHGMFNLAGLILLVLSPLFGTIAFGMTMGFVAYFIISIMAGMIKGVFGSHHR